jgi:hypothetical protein
LIDKRIKLKTEKFAKECKDLFDNELKAFGEKLGDMQARVNESFDMSIKSEVIRAVNGDCAYNYRAFIGGDPDEIIANSVLLRVKPSFSMKSDKDKANIDKAEEIFCDLIKTEKHYLYHEIPYTNEYDSRYYSYLLIITNSGKLLVINSKYYYGFAECNYIYEDLEFEVPAPYMHIISLIKESIKYNDKDQPPTDIYLGLLKYIKQEIYNEKCVPLYARSIIDENDKLKAIHAHYDSNMDALAEAQAKLAADQAQLKAAKVIFASAQHRMAQEQAELAEAQSKLAADQEIYEGSIKPYLCVEDEHTRNRKEAERLKMIRTQLYVKQRALDKKLEALENIELEALNI